MNGKTMLIFTIPDNNSSSTSEPEFYSSKGEKKNGIKTFLPIIPEHACS